MFKYNLFSEFQQEEEPERSPRVRFDAEGEQERNSEYLDAQG